MATKSTLVVNLYAGPGAGKTTCAWLVAGELKKLGVVTEYVPEYAKELVWDDRTDLLDGSYKNQTAVLAEQNRRIERLRGKVDVIVTDSPLLMSSMYAKENVEQFEQLDFSMYNRCDNFNLFIIRGNGFEQEGRIHSLQESKEIDEEIKGFLDEHGVYYGTYEHNTLDVVVRNIQASLHNLQNGIKPHPKQPPQNENKPVSKAAAPAATAPRRSNSPSRSIKLTEAIKRDILIPQLAEKLGYHLEHHGGQGKLHLKEHDSLVISADGRLFSWNSTGQKGSVIDFAMATLDLTKDDALRMLRGVLDDPEFAPQPGAVLHPAVKEPVEFAPPVPSKGQWKRLYAYLYARGIGKPVIDRMVKEKLIFQDERGNLCFSGYDYDGKQKYVSSKSTATGNHFRSIAEGGKYELRWSTGLTSCDRKVLFVGEAGVDLLSLMTLQEAGDPYLKAHRANGNPQQYAYLSLDCCDVAPLQYHLAHNPQIEVICLCQDNDKGGKLSAQHAIDLLRGECGYKGQIVPLLPPIPGGDYNDYLQAQIQRSREAALECAPSF
jgi:hypothetical protein